jgi:hypothetical protein
MAEFKCTEQGASPPRDKGSIPVSVALSLLKAAFSTALALTFIWLSIINRPTFSNSPQIMGSQAFVNCGFPLFFMCLPKWGLTQTEF